MTYGKLCITSSNTGIANYITNYENGLIVNNNDFEDLADKKLWVIHNKDKWDEMRNKARKIYENNFSLDIYEQNVMKLINLK